MRRGPDLPSPPAELILPLDYSIPYQILCLDEEVRPRLSEIGFTVQDRMLVNNGVGDQTPRDPVYGMLIVGWKLEEMAEDQLVEVVNKAFEKLRR